ncbi:DUF998 domain-containing protein [Streptomyces sp. Pv4-95]|uniref:DUF998 domain-containing protein n=1 Tax=Streptomyces sp. Pv4-95 TaxID=3049543 RepID=UPI003891EA74
MRLVPWWTLVSSGCAPVVLVGAWVIAALLQGPGYEPVTQTISILGADGASGRWVLNGALIALGICHLLTAWGLRAASFAGRLALAAGGVAAIVVAQTPAPIRGGSLGHGFAVAIGFTLLAVWPVLAADRGKAVPWALRPAASITVTGLMAVGAACFLIELQGNGAAGVAERALTTMQSLWPFVVVVSCLRHPRRP